MTRKCASGAMLLLALLWAGIAHAESGAGNAVATEQSAARLVTAVTGAGDLKALPAGLEITLKSGWKTYWRSPGDAGFPPELKFDGSENVAAAELQYPTPHRFELFGLQTFGYKDQVVYPIAVTPERPGEAVKLRAHLRYLVCEQVCIPYDADLALDIPAGPPGPSDQAPLVNRFQAMVPGDGRSAGLQLTNVRVEAGNKLVAEAVSDGQNFSDPDLLVEGPASLLFGKPDVSLSDNDRHATLTVPIEPSTDTSQTAGNLTLTLTDGERGLEAKVNLPSLAPAALLSNAAAAPVAPEASPLLLILGIALLGGLILNVMPCVLPVLVLKLTSVLQHGGGEGGQVRLSFLATAAGIVSAFLALAASLVGLKLAGHEIGWGIQFQQPVFLGVLATICLVFAANLWGLFQVPLPALAGDLALAADRRAGQHKMRGAFLTGVFATVLATPCSAPFVGTAIGFALSRGTTEIFAIFLAMSVGLALPYLAVAAAPHLAVMLPRPGRWMVWLRKMLGVSMAATALWLGWVLAGQLGILRATPADQAQGEAVHWQVFDPAAIPDLVASGKVVFVDVTADWCLTCKANKTLVIDRPPVSASLNRADVVPMVADWTRPDPAISRYLAHFNRYGIPLNVVYGPKAPEGIVLPELLTSDAVEQAIRQATGG
ncbi:protein-disulfide reductase DsbD family protein [Dongia sp.]|uniref:protein-disulfide reductase DsbD family protein n=1 Tax=Dongia sp. TaxID=1977262 RepID=UPI00375113A7